ncbi:hypothetical protein A1E_00160 [Rickettsia canadensis str. McKiel]|uniref:Uncharacterized protein n=1 Tax=Rickettsia canadensis (strain McKiel) TaxID=293613 RepID=A8EXA2_RICCK|nr:hypothetical protein A1E_00160 [Rickettsia canadensis str. McKiel]
MLKFLQIILEEVPEIEMVFEAVTLSFNINSSHSRDDVEIAVVNY